MSASSTPCLRAEVATSTCQDYLDTEPCQVLLDAQSRGAPLSPRASRVLRQKRGLGLSGLQRAQRPAFAGLRVSVDAMERCGNRRPRVERLVSAWSQGLGADAEPVGEDDDPRVGASAEPKKRPRTRLTDEEVDAMRTAREHGASVTVLADRYGVHRGTVWAKTKRRVKNPLPASSSPQTRLETESQHQRDPSVF